MFVKPGQSVRVKRSSGEFEDGWRVYQCPHPAACAHIAPELVPNLKIVVGRPDDPANPEGSGISKQVKLGDLIQWQEAK